MASAPTDIDLVDVAQRAGGAGLSLDAKKAPTAEKGATEVGTTVDNESLTGPNGEIYPTEEEMNTLRRVHGQVDWMVYSVGLIEMVERFAYYGTTAVCEYWPLEFEGHKASHAVL